MTVASGLAVAFAVITVAGLLVWAALESEGKIW